MKKNHFLPIACLVAAMSAGTALQAQFGKNNLAFNKNSVIASPANKKSAKDMEALKALGSINEKISRNLMRNYPEIHDIRYFQSKGITYVHCKRNGIQTRIGYNKKGRWNHCLSYYSAGQVPASVASEVKEVYPDFSILSAVKVEYGAASVHVVIIEKGNAWKKVRVSGNGVDIMNEYTY